MGLVIINLFTQNAGVARDITGFCRTLDPVFFIGNKSKKRSRFCHRPGLRIVSVVLFHRSNIVFPVSCFPFPFSKFCFCLHFMRLATCVLCSFSRGHNQSFPFKCKLNAVHLEQCKDIFQIQFSADASTKFSVIWLALVANVHIIPPAYLSHNGC